MTNIQLAITRREMLVAATVTAASGLVGFHGVHLPRRDRSVRSRSMCRLPQFQRLSVGRIALQDLLRHQRQRGEPLPHIRVAGRQPHLHANGDRDHLSASRPQQLRARDPIPPRRRGDQARTGHALQHNPLLLSLAPAATTSSRHHVEAAQDTVSLAVHTHSAQRFASLSARRPTPDAFFPASRGKERAHAFH